MTWEEFMEVCQIGDRFVEWYRRGCHKSGADPAMRHNFDRAVDRWHEYATTSPADDTGWRSKFREWPQPKIACWWIYVAAACGFQRQQRRRMVVYLDGKGGVRYEPGPWLGGYSRPPALDEMETVCDADLLRELGAA